MAILQELALAVKQQRTEMGLKQERLAELSGLSRATINQLETGKISNLSLTRAERLANVLGLGLGITGIRATKPGSPSTPPLEMAARTGDVSHNAPLPPEVLKSALLTGVVPPGYIPQLRAVLDEAPLASLSAVVRQLANENDVRRQAIWQRMRQLAAALACTRGIWL